MNTNILHNVTNLVLLIGGALSGALLVSGCVQTVTGFDCTMSWIPPQYLFFATSAIAMLKIVVNIWRDGFAGMWKTQPPVKQ